MVPCLVSVGTQILTRGYLSREELQLAEVGWAHTTLWATLGTSLLRLVWPHLTDNPNCSSTVDPHQIMRAQWKMRSHCSQKRPWSLIGHPTLSGHCLCPSNSKCCPGTTAVWTLGVPEALVAAPTLACPVRQSPLPTVSTFWCQSPPWAHLAVQD